MAIDYTPFGILAEGAEGNFTWRCQARIVGHRQHFSAANGGPFDAVKQGALAIVDCQYFKTTA